MDNIDETAINIFTDGSSYAGPRRGGMGIVFVVVDNDGHEVHYDLAPPGYKSATNNQMELQACVEALDFLVRRYCPIDVRQFPKIVINTDSRYVVDNFNKAKFEWPKRRWHTREGAPVANAQIWKELVRKVAKVGPRVYIQWIKGHKSSENNKAADRMAKSSAKGFLRSPLATVSVRRKKTSKVVDRGSVHLSGQRLTIRVFTVEYLRVQRCWKYKYEVMSKESPYFGNVDIAYSDVALRDGHTYFVLMNNDTGNPRVRKLIREVEAK
jgi:ribonuclease HI